MALLDGIRHRPCCQIGLVGLLITEGVPAGATQNVVLHLLVPAPNSRTRAGPKHCIYGSAKFLAPLDAMHQIVGDAVRRGATRAPRHFYFDCTVTGTRQISALC